MHENVVAALVSLGICLGLYLFIAAVRWANLPPPADQQKEE